LGSSNQGTKFIIIVSQLYLHTAGHPSSLNSTHRLNVGSEPVYNLRIMLQPHHFYGLTDSGGICMAADRRFRHVSCGTLDEEAHLWID
jgi:hypothetical protein